MTKTEIIEEENEETACIVDTETQKERIRRIIEYQKSLYWSSSSSSSLSSSATSYSPFTSSGKSNSLLELMKGGNSSLGRLFNMEHTSLATYFDDYSGSPLLKPIFLWGSDTDDEICNMWASVKEIGSSSNHGTGRKVVFALENSFTDGESGFKNRKSRISNRRLTRKRSYRRLPGFGLWRCRGFRFRLRLRHLRIMICGRKF